ncbi:laminin subunit gamma-1 [Trichonephila inaurata madagascariensis]|uniref:Laminin subunit gamma-1 n=1 Tax=Trichonephila inaurata madagascariensis TaxID=2747483 RepID=A0A8X6YUG8_9ARAC|nr:laminin subunit gamma-1 [Trichonephila inaurata madagascariensis]
MLSIDDQSNCFYFYLYTEAGRFSCPRCKSFDITYVRLKFYTSRPESFAIYKRTRPGGDWIPYQYYSATCQQTYGLIDSTSVTYDDETKALCTSEFSDISPLTGGNVAFSTLEGRPSAYYFENSSLLQEWVTATDIRITLDRMNTFGDEIFGDPKVLKSYYYAVSDFAVGGRCKCNGHASECLLVSDNPQMPWETHLSCRCEHNTAGHDCEICLPFYNDQPWGRATSTDVHECKACNCNGRSNSCYFDVELWLQTGHGGHCIDCRDNTDGANCERCKENFYLREDERCVPCNCDPVGSRNLQCNNRGQCQCKPGVDGPRCNKCAANFYDFSELGCRPCGCNIAGSIDNTPACDPITGVCRCKENVEGQRCDQCKPGYFDLQEVNEFGCLFCFCFGHSSVCRSAPGYSALPIESTFVRDWEKWDTLDYHKRVVPFKYGQLNQEIEVTANSREPVYFIAPARYLGDQRAAYNQFLSFTLRIAEEGPQATLEDIVVEGNGKSISLPIFGQGNPLPSTFNQEYKFRLHEHSAYGWNPRLTPRDYISILSNLTALKIKATYTPEGTGYLDNVRLDSAHRSPLGKEATWIEMCTCPEGYVGQFCESCAPGYRHDPANGGKFARCVPCNCHGHAEYCDPETGRCICQHNTAGDNCQHCASGYYGNALTGTKEDCQPCPCPGNGACVILPDEEVACLECPEGYAGHRCDLCIDGYYAESTDPYGRPVCRKCECNENVDPNAIGNCDRTTGYCLKCVYNTGGRYCESCLPGFYGNALSLPKGDCKACNCYSVGTEQRDPDSDVLVCNYATGQCPCKPNVEGKHCDTCVEGYWNLASGQGCEPCYCDPTGSIDRTCDISTGQCNCRPGVMGQKCDQCMPLHYGFSPEGCKHCECDQIGSSSLQCGPYGQCPCRPNVEGRRCDRCKENTHNKAAGCINCPLCYNLVQDAANAHRSKLGELQELLKALKENPQLLNDDEFVMKLKQVQDKVDKLLEDAMSATDLDGKVGSKLKDLYKRLEDVRKTAGVIAGKIDDAKEIGQLGERNITIAEDIIKRALDALTGARKFLETEGIAALEKAIERSEKFGQQSEKMSEIAREARNLADEHEKEAKEIEELAVDARKIAQEAYEKARHALETPGETADNINRLERKLLDVNFMLEEVKKLAASAKDEANKTYEAALDLFTKANSINLPEADTELMKKTAAEIIEEAKKIQKQAEDILGEHQELLDNVMQQMEDAEELLKAGEKQQQTIDEMLATVDAALAKAKEAVAAGEKTLAEAKETLETLKGFDELIQESKGRADEALTRIPEIEKLITEAEEKTRTAENALRGAEQDAIESRDEAQTAEEKAEQASKHANDVLEGAEETKTEANKLRDKADELADEVAETAGVLKEYEDQAKGDEDLASQALEQANQAKNSATDASVKVKNALDTVEDILRALDGLDDIDESLLDQLEQRLEAAEKEQKEADFDSRMGELRQARDIQNQWMKDYTEEVEKLKKDVANIAEIRNALPDKCYRRVVLEP